MIKGTGLSDLPSLTPQELRAGFRTGRLCRPTSGLAPGYVQANLVMLAEELAGDFQQFCTLNAEPCPLLEVIGAGEYEPRSVPGADLRTDLPRYRVYVRGKLIDQPTDVLKYCATKSCSAGSPSPGQATPFVSFLLGCSFTFESALQRAGIPVRHIEQQCNVPMYRTSIQCKPAGDFCGPLVVSMRPMNPDQAEHAKEITASMPGSHGAPVHIGNPRAIGIQNIDSPDYGDPVEIRSGEVPVFWACGVTPLEAILRAKPELAIVHEPGHMFVTDVPATVS